MHKVYNNIDRSYELFGRSMADWIIILGVMLVLWTFVYNKLPIPDLVRLILGLGTGWITMQGVTAYRDNYPPKMANYLAEWFTQADNYIVAPDLMATPLSADDELVALEEDRLAEQRELIKEAREDRSKRRRGIVPEGSDDEEGRRALPMRRVARPLQPITEDEEQLEEA